MGKKSVETLNKNYLDNLKKDVVIPNTMTTRGKVEDLDLCLSSIIRKIQ